MFKDTKEGQTNYCLRCEQEAGNRISGGLERKHTCGKVEPQTNMTTENKCCEKCEYKYRDGVKICVKRACPCHTKKEEKRCKHNKYKDEFCPYCAGKIINKNINTPTKKWEEEFDDRFKWFFDNQTNVSLKETTIPTNIKVFISQLLNEESKKSIKIARDMARIEFRQELEKQNTKVVWNDMCEQIKNESRQELKAEILGEYNKLKAKGGIDPLYKSFSFSEKFEKGYNQALEDIKNIIKEK